MRDTVLPKLPEIYHEADRLAIASQKRHFFRLLAQYSVLFCASASTVVSGFAGKEIATVVYLLLILIGGMLLWQSQSSKFASTWYRYRAIAESLKTIAWKQMMNCTDSRTEAHSKWFEESIGRVLSVHQGCREYDNLTEFDSKETEWMKQVRSLGVKERFDLYRNIRIKDQLKWYAKRCERNSTLSKLFFVALIAAYAVAIVLGIYQLTASTSGAIWASEPVLVLAAGLLGWFESKRFDELATSYSVARVEIEGILGTLEPPNTEAELSRLVQETELVFSREHTQWAAR